MPWPAWFERPSPSPSSWWRAWKWLSSWTSVSGWEATPSSTWRFCSTGRGTHHDGVSDQSRCCQSELLWSSKICWISPDWSSGAGQTVSSHVPGRARYPASTGCWSSPWTSSWPPWAAGSCSRPSTRRTWSGRCSIAHSRSQYCPRRGGVRRPQHARGLPLLPPPPPPRPQEHCPPTLRSVWILRNDPGHSAPIHML